MAAIQFAIQKAVPTQVHEEFVVKGAVERREEMLAITNHCQCGFQTSV